MIKSHLHKSQLSDNSQQKSVNDDLNSEVLYIETK